MEPNARFLPGEIGPLRLVPRDGLCGGLSRICWIAACFLVCGKLSAEVEGFAFRVPVLEAGPGESVTLTVEGAHEASVQGFSFAARYPPADLEVGNVHFEDTILDAIHTEFFEAVVDPDGGTITIGALVDTEPPFTGHVIPAIGQPLAFFHIEATVSEDAEDDIVLAVEDGIGSPPIDNLFVVDNYPVRVSEKVPGGIQLRRELRPIFLRGDANLDSVYDISDALEMLEHQFRVSLPLDCSDAADVNDDQVIDLSDPIFLLGYLFVGGEPPPPPLGVPGPDPTADEIDCEHPLGYVSVIR